MTFTFKERSVEWQWVRERQTRTRKGFSQCTWEPEGVLQCVLQCVLRLVTQVGV